MESKTRGRRIDVKANRSHGGILSTLLHEAQHWVQDKEGFAFGAAGGSGMHKLSAGEIEARNVQARRWMSAEERAELPFNETLAYPGEAVAYTKEELESTMSFSMVHVPLYQEILDTFEQRIAKDGSVVWSSRVSGEDSMLICAYPEVLNMIIPWKRDVIASRDVVQKLMNKHGLLPQDVAKLPQALWNPVAVFEDPDVDKGFIVITDILALNFSPKRKTKKKNKDQQVRQMKQVMAVLELRADKNNVVITEVVSAYSADSTEKYKKLIEDGFLRYADTERALTWASAEGDSVLQLLTTALLHSGSGVILKDRLQNVNTDFSASMARVTQRSMELLEARGEEEVAQDIMADLKAACERLSVVLADDDVDARRGTGLKVYVEMQALMSAVRAALPEKYLKQGNLDMLLRWASVYAQMAQNGNVPARGAIKGKAFDMFVDALQRQAERDRLQGMTEEEARDALMEIASDKLETAFLKVARDSVRRLDQFLKDRALERIEWLYTHAYPTREEGKAWSRGKMDAENYRIVNAAWALVRGSLDKRKEVENEMRALRRVMRSVREEMKEGKVPEEEGKRRLKKLNEQMLQKELEAMKAAAEDQANAIKAISDELEALSTENAGYERDEATRISAYVYDGRDEAWARCWSAARVRWRT